MGRVAPRMIPNVRRGGRIRRPNRIPGFVYYQKKKAYGGKKIYKRRKYGRKLSKKSSKAMYTRNLTLKHTKKGAIIKCIIRASDALMWKDETRIVQRQLSLANLRNINSIKQYALRYKYFRIRGISHKLWAEQGPSWGQRLGAGNDLGKPCAYAEPVNWCWYKPKNMTDLLTFQRYRNTINEQDDKQKAFSMVLDAGFEHRLSYGDKAHYVYTKFPVYEYERGYTFTKQSGTTPTVNIEDEFRPRNWNSYKGRSAWIRCDLLQNTDNNPNKEWDMRNINWTSHLMFVMGGQSWKENVQAYVEFCGDRELTKELDNGDTPM